jgi:hypothetical protein
MGSHTCSVCTTIFPKKASLSAHQRQGKCKGKLSEVVASMLAKRRDSKKQRHDRVRRREDRIGDSMEDFENAETQVRNSLTF